MLGAEGLGSGAGGVWGHQGAAGTGTQGAGRERQTGRGGGVVYVQVTGSGGRG